MIIAFAAIACVFVVGFSIVGSMQPTIEAIAPNSTTASSMITNINTAFSLVSIFPFVVGGVLIAGIFWAIVNSRTTDEDVSDTDVSAPIQKYEPEPEETPFDWECDHCGALNPDYKYLCHNCGAYKTAKANKYPRQEGGE